MITPPVERHRSPRRGYTIDSRLPGIAVALWAALPLVAAPAAEPEWKDETRLLLPALDAEVWVSTALRLDPEHTETYVHRLEAIAREVFQGAGGAPAKAGRPTWTVTLDHGGTIDLGTRAIVRTARGRVFRDGSFVGGGEERRWIVPVRRRCTIRVAMYKRVGETFLSSLKFAFREPAGWDEQLYGGIPVGSAVRVAGEETPKCPLTLGEARALALRSLEPPRAALAHAILTRLIGLKIERLRDVRGAAVKGTAKLGLYAAHVAVDNRTPWFLHAFRGKLFAPYRSGDRRYAVDLEFAGTLAPGRTHLLPCRAADFEGDDVPPTTLTGVRWSLKGAP